MINRKVKIHSCVKVILIPSISEYIENYDSIWWSLKDLENFKFNYITSLKVISNLNNIGMEESKKILNNV